MNIRVCFSPVLYPHYKEDGDSIVVVTDIFRATTTMCMALSNGAKSIIPVETEREAIEYKRKGYLVGGERNVIKFESANFGNSPFEYTPENVLGKDIVISTTNGTRAIKAAADADCLIIGAFSNINSVAQYCIEKSKNVMILCSGWKNHFSTEDTLFAGALIELLNNSGFEINSDDARIALSMWNEAKHDIIAYISCTEHFNRLKANDLLKDAYYCLEQNTLSLLPIYDKYTKKISIKSNCNDNK